MKCYEADTCLHKDQLCAACKGNQDLESPKVNFYERKRGKICPFCRVSNPDDARTCWYCHSFLK